MTILIIDFFVRIFSSSSAFQHSFFFIWSSSFDHLLSSMFCFFQCHFCLFKLKKFQSINVKYDTLSLALWKSKKIPFPFPIFLVPNQIKFIRFLLFNQSIIFQSVILCWWRWFIQIQIVDLNQMQNTLVVCLFMIFIKINYVLYDDQWMSEERENWFRIFLIYFRFFSLSFLNLSLCFFIIITSKK